MNSENGASNPAGRLYAFLRRAQNLHAVNGTNVGQQLYRLFPFAQDANDHLTFSREVGVVVHLVDEIKLLLEVCDPKQLEVFKRSESTLKGFINIIPLGQQWASFLQNSIREADLTTLLYVSITLDRHFPESIIDAEEIDKIKVELNSLYETVSESSIDLRLKFLVLESLQSISWALKEYELRGAKGLDSALGEVIGRAILHPNFAATSTREKSETGEGANETSHSWERRFWNLMGRIAQNLDQYNSLRQILDSTKESRDLLTAGASQS